MDLMWKAEEAILDMMWPKQNILDGFEVHNLEKLFSQSLENRQVSTGKSQGTDMGRKKWVLKAKEIFMGTEESLNMREVFKNYICICND